MVIVTGWIISKRHRYVTEVIFSSGRVGDGHWRGSSLLQPPAWDIDTFFMRLAKLVVTILAPGATFFWAVDDTLCRKRGLTLYGSACVTTPSSPVAQIPGQLGTRLGRADPDRRLPPLGTVQSLRLAHRHALVPQPPRADKGKKNPKGKKGSRNPPNPSTIRIIALDLN